MATSEVPDQQHVPDATTGYGQFLVDLAEHLPRDVVLKLATAFGFSAATISNFETVTLPALQFVRELDMKGILKEDCVTELTDALERNGLHGIAKKVQRSFDKTFPETLIHENYPYLSNLEVRAYKENPAVLQLINDTNTTICETRLKGYDLKENLPSESQSRNEGVEHLRVSMIGKTGSGKSATANSLLGEKVFPEDDSSDSVTASAGIATTKIGDRLISVVDTPGVKDTSVDDIKTMREISRVAYLMREGVHVFIWVWNASESRFTKENEDVLHDLKDVFGKTFTDHCLIVFSNVEGKLIGGKSLEDYISSQKKNTKMGEFLETMGWRITAVNNTANIPAEKQRNQTAMIYMIDKIVRHNSPKLYTNKLFQCASQIHASVQGECSKYHPAIVSAVIEFFDSQHFLFQPNAMVLDEVFIILVKSRTGIILEREQVVKLIHADRAQSVSLEKCKEEITHLWDFLLREMRLFGQLHRAWLYRLLRIAYTFI